LEEHDLKKIKRKPPSAITKENLIGVILITIMCVTAFYYALSSTQAWDRPFGSRLGEAILGTMLYIASPEFWAILMLCVFFFEIGRLSIQFIREKRAEKIHSK